MNIIAPVDNGRRRSIDGNYHVVVMGTTYHIPKYTEEENEYHQYFAIKQLHMEIFLVENHFLNFVKLMAARKSFL